jgi:hypothetical protein
MGFQKNIPGVSNKIVMPAKPKQEGKIILNKSQAKM